MKTYEFSLVYALPRSDARADSYLDALFEAGCDDAVVGVAVPGRIGLSFLREAASAEAAIRSAMKDIRKAIPKAVLIEAGPDLVNLSEIAAAAEMTRQNIQKYATGKIRTVTVPFAPPVITGSPSLYRLCEVGTWLQTHAKVELKDHLLEISRQTAQLNLRTQRERLASLG